jgi:hypothetical protein
MYTSPMAEPRPRKPTAFDFPVLVLVATACVGILACVMMMGDTGIKEAQAQCLIAAALAFGLLSNALWRR